MRPVRVRPALFAACLAAGLAAGSTLEYSIETVAGSYDAGDGGSALSASLGAVEGLATDAQGYLYISDALDHRIRRVDGVTGEITTIAGIGRSGPATSGGPAAAATLNRPYGLAAGRRGVLYIADYGNACVRRVGADGVITTVAGGGGATPALRAPLRGPRNVAVDRDGNLYIADFDGQRVYRCPPSGEIAVVAGTGTAGWNGDGPALSSHLNGPAGIAVGPDGSLYLADSGNRRVVRIHGGLLTTVLGADAGTGDLYLPTGVAVDDFGIVYAADSGAGQIYRFIPGVAPVGLLREPGVPGSVRDVAPGAWPYAGGGRHVFRIDLSGDRVPVAGSGAFGRYEDGVPASRAWLDAPIGVAIDPLGRLLIAEEGRRRVRRVDSDGMIVTVAQGEEVAGGASAALKDPVAVVVAPDGAARIADHQGHRVFRLDLGGVLRVEAGDGTGGASGDGGPASHARLRHPRGLAADAAGNVFVADTGNHRIRRIRPDGRIDTVAGTGIAGYRGDGGSAVEARLNSPGGVAAGPEGSLYIADTGNHVIRMVSGNGIMTTVAGAGLPGFDGDGAAASTARLHAPTAVMAGPDGALWIADTGNHRVRRVSADGVIDTVAGVGTDGFSGDGGPARSAQLASPSALAIDGQGRIYIADPGNQRVRRLTAVFSGPIADPPPAPVADCQVVHGATFRPGPLAPGQIVTLFGEGIGPVQPAVGRYTAGALPFELDGVEVRADGIPAPLFSAQAGQINAQLPYALAGRGQASVEVFAGGVLRAACQIALAASAPGLFTLAGGAGQVIAVHEDGSLNAPDRPARGGSVVVLFATGEGLTDPPAVEGVRAEAPYPRPLLPVHVRVGGLPAEVLYAGAAPGYAGLMQINVQLPGGFAPTGSLPVELYVGAAVSQRGVQITLR